MFGFSSHGRCADHVGNHRAVANGARQYHAPSGAWHNPDRLAGNYPHLSPYAYCANNPLSIIDPTGMIIEDPDNLVETFRNNILDIISNLKNKINDPGCIDYINALKGIIKEIDALVNSDITYNVSKDNDISGGETFYDYDKKNTIIIKIGNPPEPKITEANEKANMTDIIGVIAHEMKHAYQFEIGDISFSEDNNKFGITYDIYDEVDAYNRERMLHYGASYFVSPKSIEDNKPMQFGKKDVLDIGESNNIQSYKVLPKKRINVNSKYFKNELKELYGQNPKEIYH